SDPNLGLIPGTELYWWTRYEKILNNATLLKNTAILTYGDIMKLNDRDAVASTPDCIFLGDLQFARDSDILNRLKNGIEWSFYDTKLWIFPKDSSLQIVGFRNNTLFISLPDGNMDAIFRQGICLYVREHEKLSFAQHWVPKSGKD
ncbi:MAG: hypothetical protein HY537_06830, partial [Deltaproteobacteria bacterium]|nr:hypothetical protein [Deltaproteobacteria bacterium]